MRILHPSRVFPATVTGVRWDHPLVDLLGIERVWVAARHDIVYANPSRSALTPTTAAIDTGDVGYAAGEIRGVAVRSRAYGSGLYTDLGALPVMTAFVVGAIFRSESVNTFSLSSRSTATAQGFEILVGAGSVAGNDVLRFRSSDGVARQSGNTSGLNDGQYHHYIASWGSGAAAHYHVDGQRYGDTDPDSGTITHTQNLFAARRGATATYTGNNALIYVGTRYADPDVTRLVSVESAIWEIFEPQRRRTYFLPAAAPPGGFIAAWARNSNTVIQVVA